MAKDPVEYTVHLVEIYSGWLWAVEDETLKLVAQGATGAYAGAVLDALRWTKWVADDVILKVRPITADLHEEVKYAA